MTTISPCLWFDGQAEKAATFYVSLFPDSRIDKVSRAPGDYPGGKKGDALRTGGARQRRPAASRAPTRATATPSRA